LPEYNAIEEINALLWCNYILMIKKYAVIGNPISHSLSPVIHREFAQQHNIKLGYEKILAEEGSFKELVKKLVIEGYSGINVTLPFKLEAASLSDEKSINVELTKSANTLTFRDGKIISDSTDGIGLVNDLKKNNFSLGDKNILLLGAGGAANGVIPELLKCSPKKIFLWNRTLRKAEEMKAYWLSHYPEKIEVMNVIFLENIDLIVNATSSSISSSSPPINLTSANNELVCYDMMYGEKTPFIKAAEDLKLMNFDGLGMLIEQAAASFKIWHSLEVDTKIVEKKLR